MLQFSRSIQTGLWLLMLLVQAVVAPAQVRTQRFTQPQDFGQNGTIAQRLSLPTLSLPALDTAPLFAQDEREAKAGMPFRFGLNREVSIDIIRFAAKAQQGGKRTYAYRIDAAGAFSLNLIFDRFRLKKGATLTLYNGDRTMLIGPITDAQNPQNGNPAGGEFWTDLMQGSNLTLELQEPLAGDGTSELHLRSVVHGYKNLFGEKVFGQAGSCIPNLTCFPDFQTPGDGVAMILLAGGTRLCTGSMLTDARQSFRSFFLSAFHCADSNGTKILDDNEIAQAENWLVRFNYQSPTCSPSQEDLDVITLNGTTFRAAYADTDFLLLELRQQVPAEVNATYNGWNRKDETTSNNFTIHHPRGDVKKISFTNADTQISGYQGVAGDKYLISFWGNQGVTDPGSSGSPLFDGNRRVVGQLRGGPSFCGATGASRRDYYGRVFTSWTGGNTSTNRLSTWLDPTNRAPLTTDGAKPTLSGPTTLTGAGTFALNVGNASVVAWAVSGGAGAVSPTTGTGNTANLLALSSNPSLTITFSVQAGQAYPIQFSAVFSTNITPPPTGGSLALLLPTYDCATGAITFNPTGGDGTSIMYTAVGVSRPSFDSRTGVVESGLRADPKPLVILASQSGNTVSQTFDFAAFCSLPPSSTTTPPPSSTTTAPPTSGPLALLQPAYDCATGAITFNPTGGDGSPITYSAVGIRRAIATSSTGIVEAELRADPKPLVITAEQRGVTVSQTFDFARFCTGARVASSEPDTSFQMRVLGNPVTDAIVRLAVRGGSGQQVSVRVSDMRGRVLAERRIRLDQTEELVEILISQLPGVYLITVQADNQELYRKIPIIKL